MCRTIQLFRYLGLTAAPGMTCKIIKQITASLSVSGHLLHRMFWPRSKMQETLRWRVDWLMMRPALRRSAKILSLSCDRSSKLSGLGIIGIEIELTSCTLW